MSVNVTLTPSRLAFAAQAGCMRQLRRMARASKPMYGEDPATAWERMILGAMAECAVAQWLDVYWCGFDARDGQGDVGRVQVRHTVRPDGRLILHDEWSRRDQSGKVVEVYEPDNAPYVLVRGVPPNFELAGWIFGCDGKSSEYVSNPTGKDNRTAYFVPADKLHDMASLKSHLFNLKEISEKTYTGRARYGST